MRFLFVMDPAEKMLPDKDTTFAFMRGARARGHECLHSVPLDVYNIGRDVYATARPIRVSDSAPHLEIGQAENVEIASLDAVFIRKDPPFDSAYTHLTQQLDFVKDRTLCINDPRGLRDANEKLFTFNFVDFMPKTLVAADPARILAFVKDVGGKAVMKPIDGAGGTGVVTLATNDRNSRALVDLLTHEGNELVLVQEFLPAIEQGDKRVIVLDGEPIGSILRVPRADDFRANIHVGGDARASELDPTEAALVRQVGEELKRHGLWFVGLDLIGGKLIEVNVTSPTGLQQIARFAGRPVEQDVIAWVERRVNG